VTFVKMMKPIEIAEQYETTHFGGDRAVLETVGHINAVQQTKKVITARPMFCKQHQQMECQMRIWKAKKKISYAT